MSAYITAAYWVVRQSGVDVREAWTATFAGIESGDVAVFIAAQLLGAAAATALFQWLIPIAGVA